MVLRPFVYAGHRASVCEPSEIPRSLIFNRSRFRWNDSKCRRVARGDYASGERGGQDDRPANDRPECRVLARGEHYPNGIQDRFNNADYGGIEGSDVPDRQRIEKVRNC
jgi:hypothetical protein